MKTAVMKHLWPLAVAAALLALGGCAGGPDVRAEYDPTTQFTQYQTFGFVSPLGTDRYGYEGFVSQYLRAATQREMEARGMRRVSDNPQLLVNFNAVLTEKLHVTTVPAPMIGIGYGGGYYGYRAGIYGAWPLYYDQSIVTPYREGTLNIDIVDAARKQLVWEGVVTDVVTQEMQDNLRASLDAAVAAAFAKYPIQPASKLK